MDLIAQQPLVLLAEADAIVGIDLSDALERAGYRVLGPFATSHEALVAMERERPALAIVDVVLRDGVCTVLGDELRKHGLPFLIHSSLQQQEGVGATTFQGAPWLSKPALPEDVVLLLGDLASRSSSVGTKPTSTVRLAQIARTSGCPLVRKLEGFVALSEADRTVLERIGANPRVYGPRVDLVREDDPPDGVILIMEGMACRHKVRGNGARQITAYLVPGDVCDLDVALLDTMDHTITTLSACKVVRIAPETIAALMQNHPQIARALRMTTLVDEATLREWLMNVGRRSAMERIAHLFCELLVRLEVVGLSDGGSYALPLTQMDLGDTTGLSNVHVNRSLQELRRRGLIELKSGRLTILNLPKLRAIAEFRSNYLHLGNQAAA